VPDEPLRSDRHYSLVLDARTEFPLRLPAAPVEDLVESASYDGVLVRIRFDREVNPLTLNPRTVQVTTPTGILIPYFLEWAIDRREVVLLPGVSEPAVIVNIDGPESVSGTEVRHRRHRLVIETADSRSDPPTYVLCQIHRDLPAETRPLFVAANAAWSQLR
jgi:hypothetical protein